MAWDGLVINNFPNNLGMAPLNTISETAHGIPYRLDLVDGRGDVEDGTLTSFPSGSSCFHFQTPHCRYE